MGKCLHDFGLLELLARLSSYSDSFPFPVCFKYPPFDVNGRDNKSHGSILMMMVAVMGGGGVHGVSAEADMHPLGHVS